MVTEEYLTLGGGHTMQYTGDISWKLSRREVLETWRLGRKGGGHVTFV